MLEAHRGTGAARASSAGAPSFWLDQIGAGRTRPALEHSVEADVCIIGGGFTGLWTAYELRRADPSLEVVVLEARHVGFGASGRNGGWVLGKISGSPDAWRRRGGADAPGAMARAINATVGEIGAAVDREGIDCDWKHGGSLIVAQSETQLERLRAELAREREWYGPDCPLRLLSASELRERVAVRDGMGALLNPFCARVHPGKLVTGLAGAAEQAGAVVYEGSPVSELGPGRARVHDATVRARNVILATEGYTANLPGRRRALLPMNSSMIITEPLRDEVWATLGWDGAETMLDGSYVYTYSQRTADGRIAIGGRGVPYRFGSRTDREGAVPAQTVAELRQRLAALFEPLGDVSVERAWHGVLGVSRDWCPTVGFDRSSGFGVAGGYAGEGVAASNLAARTLRDLILARDTELTRLPWVGRSPRRWEPEPLRFLGARGIYALYRLADRREAHSGRGDRIADAANRIAGR
jgi:glycine/D-amino acid oxidase-like deaminating enzyme